MFTTLLVKEIREMVTTGKFVIAALLCLVLIPLGMFLTLEEYQQRLQSYRSTTRIYQEQGEGKVGATFKAEGYRPPSPLSVFSTGLESIIPNKAVTSRRRGIFRNPSAVEGIVAVTSENGTRNPLSALFGKIDFLFNVSFVLSIFALLFTFSGITAEKEQGTLKLMLSNPVPRWSVLLAKILGNFLVFLVPFFVSVVMGVLVLSLTGIFPLSGPGILPSIAVILAVTTLLFFTLFTLGTLISTFSHRSINAVITALSVWVLFVLVIPKLSPMVAQALHPVESEEFFFQKLRKTRGDIEQTLTAREDKMFGEFLKTHGLTQDEFMRMETREGKTPERKTLEAEYEFLVGAVREEFAGRLVSETRRLQIDRANEQEIQESIALYLSRLSPVTCYTCAVTELAGTGLLEIENFTRRAEAFQEQVEREVYSKFTYKQYGTGGSYNVGFWSDDGVDPAKIPVPHMSNYRTVSIGVVLGERWADILLLAIYAAGFFAASFARFIRYDVR